MAAGMQQMVQAGGDLAVRVLIDHQIHQPQAQQRAVLVAELVADPDRALRGGELAQHPRQVFTRNQLLDSVWGMTEFIDASTVTVHIRRLREKIERDPATPARLVTVWGVGYKFEP